MPIIRNTINNICLLSDTLSQLIYTISEGKITIELPADDPCFINPVIDIHVEGMPGQDNNMNKLGENKGNQGISIFPVPIAKGLLYFLQEESRMLKTSIYTSSGLLIWHQYSKENLTSLDTSSWTAGQYIVIIESDNILFSQLIINGE
jgi:hypothetical protein